MVMAVHAGEEGAACAGDGGFEASGLRDDEVGGDAAVGPAADGELIWVGNALLDRIVNHGYVVLIVLVAPIGPNGFGVVLPAAGGAAGIREEDGVAVGGEKLLQVVELGVVGPDRSAVRAEDGGVLLARDAIHGLIKVAGNEGAVFAFE